MTPEQERGSSEAEQWQLRLDLGLAGEWHVAVQLWDAPGDALTVPPGAQTKLNLSIANGDWRLRLWRPAEGLQTEVRSGETGQNDLSLPELARLDDFPSWLTRAEKVLGTTFCRGDAWLSVGRKRTAKARILRWLVAG